jgi:plastocyanin
MGTLIISARRLAVAIATFACMMSCGGAKGGGTQPMPTSPPPPSGNTGGPTITIANNSVSPKNVTVARGDRVTFINSDTQSHDMQSDPHPTHTDCQEINQVGFLNPSQSKQTGTFSTGRTCGYHDHNRDMVDSLKGTITIQ